MVILGLGSNIGHREAHLRDAIVRLSQIPDLNIIKQSAVYESEAMVPEGASSDWFLDYLNMALLCETSLEPVKLLDHLKSIEKDMGREYYARWSPRIIDIDILAWDDLQLETEHLSIPHAGLEIRPFALWPLLDVKPDWMHPVWNQPAVEKTRQWGSCFAFDAPFKTHQVSASIDPVKLVAVLNVTPDSFSDGGQYLDPKDALNHAQALVDQGAGIIDIGAESTRFNGAEPITHEEEWRRLEPVLAPLRKQFLDIILSVDTRHAETAKKAIEIGVDWINDVTGFKQQAMIDAVKDSSVDLVIMHSLKIPEDRSVFIPKDQDPVKVTFDWGVERINYLVENGIDKDRIIFDPGIGFGKHAEQSVAVMKQIKEFHRLGTRLFVGHSRKSFFSLVTDLAPSERDLETAVVTCQLAANGVHYIRVHNLEVNSRALKAHQLLG